MKIVLEVSSQVYLQVNNFVATYYSPFFVCWSSRAWPKGWLLRGVWLLCSPSEHNVVQGIAVMCVQLYSLGSKLRRNSGRNFGFGRNFGNFGPGVTEILFLQFAFLRCSSKCVIFKGLFYTTPHCEPCLGLSERAYQSFFRLRDSWSRRYQQSWTSIEAKTPEFLSEPRTSPEPERNRGQFRTFDRKEFLRNFEPSIFMYCKS
jgi:hypothetical protein